MSVPPLPTDGLRVLPFDALELALAKLDIKVPLSDIVAVVREEEAKRKKTQAERRASMAMLALHPPAQPSGLKITTTPKLILNPPPRAKGDPLAKERRRRLFELTKEAFPDGKVPDPFTLAWLALSEDATANKLPFIQASRIAITSYQEDKPEVVFENVWCLWDTGAQTSFILTSLLDPAVRKNENEGSAIMEITFSGTNQTMDSVIHFRPTLPNGITFIILGQHALLNRLHYQIQLISMNPRISELFPPAYGQIDLISWSDPVTDQVVLL